MKSRKKNAQPAKGSIEQVRNRKLSDKEIADRQEQYIALDKSAKKIRKDLSKQSAKARESLKDIEEQKDHIAAELDAGWELRKQKDLFADEAEGDGAEKVPQKNAAAALAKIADKVDAKAPASKPVGPDAMAERSRAAGHQKAEVEH